MITKEIIENIVGFEIKNELLFQNAFIHKSALKEEQYKNIFFQSNERLEFIGDSVLSLVVCEFLYNRYPHENEGFMTRIKTKIVSGKKLSYYAMLKNLDRYIIMDQKGLSKEWNKNSRLLEDVFEALIGAIYCDRGFEYAKKFIVSFIETDLCNEENFLEDTNYKDNICKIFPDFSFKVSNETGPEHKKQFIVQLSLSGKLIAEGYGCSKKDAEQNASYKALIVFQKIKYK